MNRGTDVQRRSFVRGTAALGLSGLVAGCGFIGGESVDLAYGSDISNRITSDGPRDPYYDDLCATHTFEGSAGDSVEISMSSDQFDTYLILEGPNDNMVSENDDGGQGFNSVLTTQLPSDGVYTIWSGSFSGEATGQYSLSLERG